MTRWAAASLQQVRPTADHSSAVLIAVITTLGQQRRAGPAERNCVLRHRVGHPQLPPLSLILSLQAGCGLHTTRGVTEAGERVWLLFDPSRPCIFTTTETRYTSVYSVLSQQRPVI